MTISPPVGLTGLCATFGDPFSYVNKKTHWETLILKTKKLSTPIPYAYIPGTKITSIRAHYKIVDLFIECIEKCLTEGVTPKQLTYGGIYCWRSMRGGSKLSSHAWGVSIDFNPAKNPRGIKWKDDGIMLHPKIIKVFCSAGFSWGDNFSVPDPMHFQFVRNY